MVFQPVTEHTRHQGELIDRRVQQAVWLWDCGPDEPEPPDEPVPPSFDPKDPKYPLALLRHRRAVNNYDVALAAYDIAEREYQRWQTSVRGPVERLFDSSNAREALWHDQRAVKEGRQKQRRWWLSSRTRGSQTEMSAAQYKNLGLPSGVMPGPGHQEELERQIAGDKEFVEILKADPHFGQEIRR